MIWQDLEREAPAIARWGKERLEHTRVALLGTLRRDVSPRISPVEPYFAFGHLLFGSMASSLKTHDLQRDPRCVLHSAISSPDGGEGELKLCGRAILVPDLIRGACRDAWWMRYPPEVAAVFSLEVEEATVISWDIDQGEMLVRRWTPGAGSREDRRRYP